jgi:RimJ/RimL family protein N-acetyltransferase
MEHVTDRLQIRPLGPSDVDDLVELYTFPEVLRFQRALDRAAVLEWLTVDAEHWREHGYGQNAVHDRRDGRFLGRVALKWWEQFGETEAGWAFRPDAWGQGYATEAARAVVDWALRLRGLPYVTAMIVPDNVRSQGVAARLGMTPLRDDELRGLPVVVHGVTGVAWRGGA